MINDKGELVMELMHEEEKKEILKIGLVYNVQVGESSVRSGILTSKNRNDLYKILVNSLPADRMNDPRIYPFREYSFENDLLKIRCSSGPEIISKYSKKYRELKPFLEKLE